MCLSRYQQKRNFAVTAEPSGAKKKSTGKKADPRFVIQKHDASRLHYDFRLEMEGVLKSWAVPKGLPWVQAQRHLAVEVEDHPLDYADFEGIIPAGQYGGGTVMVWDRGTYEVTHAANGPEGLRQGKFHVILHGAKTEGEWALIRIKNEGGKNQWLLMKTGGSIKPVSANRDDQSVKSGRTMKQIATDRDAEWQSNRPAQENSFKARVARAAARKGGSKDATQKPKPPQRLVTRKAAPKEERGQRVVENLSPELAGLPSASPRFLEPMKPRLVETSPKTGDWIYELKFDGIRALAIKRRGDVQLISRNQNVLNSRFPEIAQACPRFAADECVVDGEVVALDPEGRSSFQLLQRTELEEERAPLLFYAFDLLQLEGRSVLSQPLSRRKELLARLLPADDDTLRFSGELGDNPELLLVEIKRRGLEGIVGKRRDSSYEPGRRSGAWIKLKCVAAQEFVIGGFTPPAGARQHFGALLVGYYEKPVVEGSKSSTHKARLLFAGKVGAGFDAKSLAAVHRAMQKVRRDKCPFADLPSKQGGEWVQGITPAAMRKCFWVDPVLVCQVKFAEWTRDLKLRQPVFLGLRDDKKAGEIGREKAGAG